MNTINTIFPYKYEGMWVFDDARVDLMKEPFVEGADTMIDHIVQHLPNPETGFILLFSSTIFPEHTEHLKWRRADGGGNWYYSERLEMEGWLCPALLKYFQEPPKEIFIQVKAKPAV